MRDSQVSGRLADDLSTHFCEALQRASVFWSILLEPLLDDVNLFLDHVHRLIEIVVKLLSYFLKFRLKVLSGFGFAVFEKLGLELLTASRDTLPEHLLIVCDILTEGFRLEHYYARFTKLLMCFLQDCLVHCLFRMNHRLLHFLVVALNRLFYRAITFILTHVWPGILNVWDGTLIDCGSVRRRELKKHLTGDVLAIKLFWAHFFKDLGAQLRHLVDKFWTQLFIRHTLQVL